MNKRFLQTFSVLLIVTLLTFNVGKVERVRAMATGAVVATGVAIIIGGAFIGYLALSGANVSIPSDISSDSFLADVGRKVLKFGSGSSILSLYSSASEWVLDKGLSFGSYVVDYTDSLMNDFYQCFNNRYFIQNLFGFEFDISNLLTPTVDFPYLSPSLNFTSDIRNPKSSYDYTTDIVSGFTRYLVAVPSYFESPDVTYFAPVQLNIPNLVNYYSLSDSLYYVGTLSGSSIIPLAPSNYNFFDVVGGLSLAIYDSFTSQFLGFSSTYLNTNQHVISFSGSLANNNTFSLPVRASFPILADKVVYAIDSSYSIVSTANSLVPTARNVITFPDSDDDDSYIPFLRVPPSGGNWGSRILDILDSLEDGAFDLASILAIIDALAGESDDDSYTYYDESSVQYIYSPTYNISSQSEEMPINLNTISLYTDNQYLNTLEDSVSSVSDFMGDYASFWYDIDPTIVYVILGGVVLAALSCLLNRFGGG